MSKDKKKPDTRPAAGAETSAEEAADLDAVMVIYAAFGKQSSGQTSEEIQRYDLLAALDA